MEPHEWFFHNIIENNVLSSTAALATIITVLASAGKYFKEKDNEKKRASKNLALELANTLENLDYKKHPDDFCHVDIVNQNGEKIIAYFMNRDLNHDFYDSMISSGKINFLEPNLQQDIQDMFRLIKMHNKFLETVMNMQVRQMKDAVPEKSFRYYEWLNKNEVQLRREIPKMLAKLQKHF